ncbi:hypothetical protein F4678DRAFT_443756 [Xylaria arbuscula]|nr:hypothetical protein F4678DRAFT_443756 [Xylaria arbuscula]
MSPLNFSISTQVSALLISVSVLFLYCCSFVSLSDSSSLHDSLGISSSPSISDFEVLSDSCIHLAIWRALAPLAPLL